MGSVLHGVPTSVPTSGKVCGPEYVARGEVKFGAVATQFIVCSVCRYFHNLNLFFSLLKVEDKAWAL